MRAFSRGRKMPLPNILEFIGTNITQRKFQEAQEKLLNYLGIEVPTKTELNSEILKLNNAITPKADKIYVDSALSSFQNGALKTYPTLAAANADIANITLNTKVEVLSATEGGSYYKATAGATSLTKSPYDPLTQAKADATTKANAAEANANTLINSLVNTSQDILYTLIDADISAPTSGGTNRIFTATTSKTAVIKVNPSTEYTIEKTESSRFRFIEFTVNPVVETTLGFVTKSNDVSHVLHVDSFENTVEAFTFTTRADTQYIAVNIKTGTENIPLLQVKTGSVFDFTAGSMLFSKDAFFNGAKLSDAAQIKIGKNKFDGSYLQDVALSGAVDAANYNRPLSTTVSALTSVIKIKPNTTYTISKTASTRFRIGLAKFAPMIGKSNVKMIAGETNDAALNYTFTSGSLDRYLVLYLSNTNTMPDFLQLEEGTVQTEWETHGYDFKNKAQSLDGGGGGSGGGGEINPDGYLLYKDIGVGNAYYAEKGGADVWTNSSKTVAATDDTAALQAEINRGGVISLNGSKSYKVSASLLIDMTKVKKIKGNGATIVVTTDVPILDIFGSMTTNAGPENQLSQLMVDANRKIKGIKLTSASGFVGTAARIRNTFKLDLGVDANHMKDGYVLEGVNRNIKLNSSAYAMQGDCLRFAEGSNLHQGFFETSDLSYANKIIHFDNPAEIYNLQFNGGDCELGQVRDPVNAFVAQHSILHMRMATGTLDDVIFSGMTFEAHYAPQRLVKLEGASLDSIKNVQFFCHFGNADQNIFEIQGISGLFINGIMRDFKGYAIEVLGAVSKVTVNSNINSSASAGYGGGIIKAVGSFNLNEIILNINASGANRNAIWLDCNLDGFHCSNNIIGLSGLTNYDDTMGLIHINASNRAVRNTHIKGNIIKNSSAVTDIVKVVGNPSRIRITGNDAFKAGAYPTATSAIISNDNYAPVA